MIFLFWSPLIFAPDVNWVMEHQIGYAEQFRSPLTIEQDGQPDIELTAEWDTKSLEMPPYWSMRTGKWDGDTAWEAELIHLKIFLENKPSEVQRFGISHGHNLLFANRAWKYGSFKLRAGVGLTISHPEVTIRNVRHNEDSGFADQGYQVSGVAIQGAGQYELPIYGPVHLVSELKLFSSYSVVRLDFGSATVPLFGVHALLGLGFHF